MNGKEEEQTFAPSENTDQANDQRSNSLARAHMCTDTILAGQKTKQNKTRWPIRPYRTVHAPGAWAWASWGFFVFSSTVWRHVSASSICRWKQQSS